MNNKKQKVSKSEEINEKIKNMISVGRKAKQQVKKESKLK